MTTAKSAVGLIMMKGETTLLEARTAFKSEKSLQEVLNDEKAMAKVATAFTRWVEIEESSNVSRIAFGEIAFKLLAKPIDEQQAIVGALARAMKLPEPSYEDVRTGRLQFASVVYGHRPELLKIKRGDKDSLAGKRVSEAIRAYKIAAGLFLPTRQKKGNQRLPRASFRATLEWVWEHIESEQEERILRRLFIRTGIEVDEFEEWTAPLQKEKAA